MINYSDFINTLDNLYPDAHCALHYKSNFQLLIAAVLSAQTTDIAVNKVTKVLFNKYPDAATLKMASKEEIYSLLMPLGMGAKKTEYILSIAEQVATKEFPSNEVSLLALPGVGRKVANIILMECFDLPAFPVDTHIRRIFSRLGLTSDNPLKIEQFVLHNFSCNYRKLHHQLIAFGRLRCHAKKPLCSECPFRTYCLFKGKGI